MPLYNFQFHQPPHSIDKSADFRSEAEKMLSMGSVYNPGAPDMSMAERMAEELCNISGAFMNVYLKFENDANVDEVFNEDSDPVYENPILMKGVWRPEPLQTELTRWGADSTNEGIIVFSRATMLKKLRRPLRPGDLIGAPQNEVLDDHNLDKQQELLFYRIKDGRNDGNFRYRWLYWKCVAEPILGDAHWLPKNRAFNGDL